MITLVRRRTLHTLRDQAKAAEADATAARTEAQLATDSAIRAEAAVEELRTALARTTAEDIDQEEIVPVELHWDDEGRRPQTYRRDITRRQLGDLLLQLDTMADQAEYDALASC